MNDITVCIGVDAKTWRQFCLSVQTWARYRPEMWAMPWIVFIDDTQLSQSIIEEWLGRTFRVPNFRVVSWPPDAAIYESQRAKMLAGHVHVPAKYVTTKWTFKLDTDAVAERAAEWLPPSLNDDIPVVAPRWHYTKGVGALPALEAWGDEVEPMRHFPRLNIPQSHNQLRVGHARFCSWCAFYRTDFVRHVSEMCERFSGPGQLPFPSEDSTRWYAAARMQLPYKTLNMKQFGWSNHSRFEQLAAKVREIMES